MKMSAGIFGCFFLLLVCVVLGIRIAAHVSFNWNCGEYLERAAVANSVELAKDQMDLAIKYLDDHQIQEGYTSILVRTPSEDVGFWYKNLTTCREELKSVIAKGEKGSSELEKSNILMKLRETLIQHNSKSTSLVCPEGIDVFPYNVLMAVILLLTIPICILGIILIRVAAD